MLKRPHTLDTGLGECNMGLSSKFPPQGVTFIVSESIIQAAQGVRLMPVNYNNDQHGKKTPRYNGSTNVLMVTNSCPIGLKGPFSREIRPCTKNLDKYSGLVRTWVLEENLLLPSY